MTDKSRTPLKAELQTWLDAFDEHGTVSAACKATKAGRSTVYEWRAKYEEFALAWADIEEATTERMEREAFRRAVEGTESDVIQKGVVVGTETKYSDTLMIFMLKSRRPEKYRENVKIEHAGNVGVNLTEMPTDQLEALAAGLQAKREQ